MVLLLVWAGCGHSSEQQARNMNSFHGYLRYSVEATSEDSTDVATFYMFSPRYVELWMNDGFLRMIETGGASRGNILIDRQQQLAYQIDTVHQQVYRGVYSNFEEASDELQAMMPDHYRPALENLQNDTTIAGLHCTEYLVIRSGYTRYGTDTRVWITNDLHVQPQRFDIETDVNRATTPLPLYLGASEGLVVRMQYETDGLMITYDLSAWDSTLTNTDIFTLPEGWDVH